MVSHRLERTSEVEDEPRTTDARSELGVALAESRALILGEDVERIDLDVVGR